jgi:hypothetical protein
LQNFKISFPAHSRRAQKVLVNEDRYFMISRYDKRARVARPGVDEMISSLTTEGETLFLENCDQYRVMDRPKSGH